MAQPNQFGPGQPPKLGAPGFPMKPGFPFSGNGPAFIPGGPNPLQQNGAPGLNAQPVNPMWKLGMTANQIKPGMVQPPVAQAGVPVLQPGIPGNQVNPGPNLQPMFPMQPPQFPKLGPQPNFQGGNLGPPNQPVLIPLPKYGPVAGGFQPPNQPVAIPLPKYGPGAGVMPFVPAGGQGQMQPGFPSFEPGRVQVSGSLGHPVPLVQAPPVLNPNLCPFCKTKPIQAKTPCGHDYCSVICMQAYMKNNYDGANFDTIPCIVCHTPFQEQFLRQTFGSEDDMRRVLREYTKEKLCPGDDAKWDVLTGYHPMPPFYCPICQQNKPHNERWDFACGHVQCGPCLQQRITHSVLVLKTYAQVTCAECPQEIPYVNVWCLVPKEVRVAYESLLPPPNLEVDQQPQLIRYDCPIHPHFIIFIDANRPWVKCDICNIRYCTKCPHWTLHQAPGCSHTRGLAPPL